MIDWRKHFTKERNTRALVRRAHVARPRIKTLTAQLMLRQPANSPGLLAAATTPDNVRQTAAAITVLEAKLDNRVSPRGQRIAANDLARIRTALR